MSQTVKPKVILIEPVLPHYRKDVFHEFSNSSAFNIQFIGGNDYQGIKSVSIENSKIFNYKTFRFLGHRFYYMKEIFKYLKAERPDIIICTGIDFHLIHTLQIFLFFRLRNGISFYWWSHATKGNQGRIGVSLRKFVYKRSTGILSYNSEGRSNLIEMKIEKERIIVVNNSINSEDYGYLNHDLFQKKPDSRFTILYTGRVTKAKKVDLLIKALSIISKENRFNYICYIIGGGDIDSLKKLAKESNVYDNIVFVGEKYGKDNHEYFLRSDVFVYPGAIGLSILHAMSFGLPIITTDDISSQFPEFELLLPGLNGDIYKDNSIDDLADKISIWKSKSETSRNTITENCINRIKELGYLPEEQSRRVIEFITKEIPG
ncbi:MAG: glycosyltransferase family 4 protein [Bacteroidales bacterium]|nr:glycosyltransferase family 4 protein [Bacteroidales bacterium]